jgi:hypothetical protein
MADGRASNSTRRPSREFGNDPLNLLAVSSSLNRQKGDGDAATWLPPNKSYRCEYVARQIAVKHKYGLWVVKAEKDAMERVLEQDATTSPPSPRMSTGPVPVTVTMSPRRKRPARLKSEVLELGIIRFTGPVRPVRDPSSNGSSSSSSGSSSSGSTHLLRELHGRARSRCRTCSHRGEPGYGSHLDRDGDGVGCE